MRFTFVILSTLLILQSCGNEFKINPGEITPTNKFGNSDTLNFTDSNGLRQGKWVIFSDSLKSIPIEEGFYRNGEKQGKWKYYNNNGSLKEIVEY